MNVLEHLSAELAEMLREDPRRVLLGEDVREGGLLGLSRAAAQEDDLRARLLATPLVPSTAILHAAGLAMSGTLPILLLGSASQLVEGFAGLREVAQLRRRSGDARSVPLLIVAPTGPGFGVGGDAADSIEALLCNLPGLRVISGAQPDGLGALTRAAAEFRAGEDPTVLLLPRPLLLRELAGDAEPVADLEGPIDAAVTLRGGERATVFAWGAAVERALEAAARTGHDVSVVDVRSLAPLDESTLIDAAAGTGKLVIAHAGGDGPGVGGQLSALFADRTILHLDAPVLRVTGAAGPLPARYEDAGLPSVDDIASAIDQVVNY